MILPNDELVSLIWAQFWQLTVLILVVGAVTHTLCRRRPHMAHLLWMLVLVKCLTPPVWSSRLGVFSWAQAPVMAAASGDEEDWLWSRMFSREERSVATVPTSQTVLAQPSSTPTVSAWRWTTGMLGVAWLSGAAGLALLTVLRWRACLGGLRRSHVATDPALEALVRRVAGQLGLRRPVRLLVTSERLGPTVFGLFRPTLVLPRAVLDGKTPHQIEPIVAHELVHLRRGDVLLGLLQGIAQLVWWFHPLVWWSNRQASRLCERCCDEEVVASLRYRPRDYARCLLDVLEQKHTLQAFVAFPGIRPVEVTSRRLENIMKHANHFHARMPRAYWLVLLAAGVLVLPGAALTQEGAVPSERDAVADESAETVVPSYDDTDETGSVDQSQTDNREDPAGDQDADADREAEVALKDLGVTIKRDEEGEVVEVHYTTSNPQFTDAELEHLGKLRWAKTRSDSTLQESPPWGGPLPVLNLRRSNITDDGLVHLKGLKSLTQLILSRTKITDEGLVHLKELTRLEKLRLAGTKITDAGLVHLKELSSLEWLEIHDNQITDVGLVHLKGLSSLEWLWIKNTQITDAGLAHLKELPNLEMLCLDGTKISDAGLEHLKRLTNLFLLMLGSTQVTDVGLEHLKVLTSLENLFLSDTEITDAGLEHLKGLNNLERLGLAETKITDAGLAHLKGLSNLTYLDLEGTEVSDEGISQLKEALPNCRIKFP